jgi:IS30 family transposase
VENAIGLLREYLPKRMDLSLVTEEHLSWIQEQLNNRPRKSLGYKTPNEVLHEQRANMVH